MGCCASNQAYQNKFKQINRKYQLSKQPLQINTDNQKDNQKTNYNLNSNCNSKTAIQQTQNNVKIKIQIQSNSMQNVHQNIIINNIQGKSHISSIGQNNKNLSIKIQSNNLSNNIASNADFENNSLQQIQKNSQYFSVNQNQIILDQQIDKKQQYNKQKDFAKKPVELQENFLSFKHINNPFQIKGEKILLSVDPKNGHFFYGRDWIVKSDGNLKNINQKQIQAQNNVLTAVIKSIGRNILNGKGIMNTSLPVNVFSKESFLQTFCKSFSYAPLYFQQLAKSKQSNIVQKFKAVLKIILGIVMLNIQMQKPFNPILGETYQGLIDGCPIYGEQISHHPPISAIFMKGRGYFIHGVRQPQIDLGLRSGLGIMNGQINVSFHNQNFHKNKITFTGTTGQIKGLVFGQRLVRTCQQTLIFDEQNRIYCCIKWGSGTLKGPLKDHQNTFRGKLLKINENTQFDFRKKHTSIKQNKIQQQLGIFHGKWTDKCYFNQQLIWDFNRDAPCKVDKYPYVLQSDCSKRKDLVQRVALNWDKAQDAKQQLQVLQRHDKKLRKQAKQRRQQYD